MLEHESVPFTGGVNGTRSLEVHEWHHTTVVRSSFVILNEGQGLLDDVHPVLTLGVTFADTRGHSDVFLGGRNPRVVFPVVLLFVSLNNPVNDFLEAIHSFLGVVPVDGEPRDVDQEVEELLEEA